MVDKIFLGNDIIDLQDVDSSYPSQRFMNRVFTDKELILISNYNEEEKKK